MEWQFDKSEWAFHSWSAKKGVVYEVSRLSNSPHPGWILKAAGGEHKSQTFETKRESMATAELWERERMSKDGVCRDCRKCITCSCKCGQP